MHEDFTDAIGAHGRARRATLTAEQLATAPASLAMWLVHAPEYHPFWAYYVCSLVHLRDVPGAQPARRKYADAGFELAVFAAQFEQPAALVDPMQWFRGALHPQNISFQFHGLSDEDARFVLRRLAHAYVVGELSPDTDYRTQQHAALRAWIKARGGGSE